MFKKYMLKLTNTVGTVQYLHKVTKDNDTNNNENSNGSSADSRKKKKYRNSMTAEMMLDIGPLVPVATKQSAEQSSPSTTPASPHQNNAPPSFSISVPDSESSAEDRPPPLRRRSSRLTALMDSCDAGYEDASPPPLPPVIRRRSSRLPATEEELYDSFAASSQTSSDQETDDRGEETDADPMAVLSAGILQLRNTLLYYSLVFRCPNGGHSETTTTACCV